MSASFTHAYTQSTDHYWWEAGCSRMLGFKQVGEQFASYSTPQGYRGGFSSKFWVLFFSLESRPSSLTLLWGLRTQKALFLIKKVLVSLTRNVSAIAFGNVSESQLSLPEGMRWRVTRSRGSGSLSANWPRSIVGPSLQNLCNLVGCNARPIGNAVPAPCAVNWG